MDRPLTIIQFKIVSYTSNLYVSGYATLMHIQCMVISINISIL